MTILYFNHFSEREESAISTVIVRGSTDSSMDDIERAVDDGVNTYKQLTRDGRCLPGAGAVEIELAMQLATYAEVRIGSFLFMQQTLCHAINMCCKTPAFPLVPI